MNNKTIIIGIGLVVVVAVGAYVLGLRNQGNKVVQEAPVQTPATSPEPQTATTQPPLTSFPKPVAKPAVKEFDVVAKQFTFEPNTITVNKGDRVRLHVRTVDVTHGFSIPDYAINEIIKIGFPKTIEFIASKAGVYLIACSEYCGAGHPNMKGALIVK